MEANLSVCLILCFVITSANRHLLASKANKLGNGVLSGPVQKDFSPFIWV